MVRLRAIKVDNISPVLDNLLRHQRDVDGETVTTSSLPPGATAPAAADLVEAACGIGALVAAESEDERRNVVGLESLDHLLRHDGSRHSSASVRGDGVDVDVVLETLEGQGAGESEDTAFLQ